MTKYTKLVTTATVPACQAVSNAQPVTSTKWTLRPPKGGTETDAQRDKREKAQAAANRIRTTVLGGEPGARRWSVTSQQKVDGKSIGSYLVVEAGDALICECAFGTWRPGHTCAHTAQVAAWVERKDRAARKAQKSAAVTEQMIERANAAARATRGEWSEEV